MVFKTKLMTLALLPLVLSGLTACHSEQEWSLKWQRCQTISDNVTAENSYEQFTNFLLRKVAENGKFSMLQEETEDQEASLQLIMTDANAPFKRLSIIGHTRQKSLASDCFKDPIVTFEFRIEDTLSQEQMKKALPYLVILVNSLADDEASFFTLHPAGTDSLYMKSALESWKKSLDTGAFAAYLSAYSVNGGSWTYLPTTDPEGRLALRLGWDHVMGANP